MLLVLDEVLWDLPHDLILDQPDQQELLAL
jgi:hypothetical protein